MDIESIQIYLREHELDGWLMADFHARNDIAVRMWQIDDMLTRRAFVLVPAHGEAVALVHRVEAGKFSHLPLKLIPYAGYRQMENVLRDLLAEHKKIAMEYSQYGRLPYIGLVEAGTIELVRDMGVNIVSSADIVASFQAILSAEQIAMARMAARNCIEIKDAAFTFITQSLKNGAKLTEHEVCEFIRGQFEVYEMTTEHGPICGVDAHAGDPHYEPTADSSAIIEPGQLILVDLWAKIKHPDAVYGDITWMAYAGPESEIPEKYAERFQLLAQARDTAVDFLRKSVDKRPVSGYEVDDACRQVIIDAGQGDYFVHRAGHSITTAGHGAGPNIDNLETEDRRKLQKGHLFSVEPGLYYDDCGFRTEIDVLIGHDGVEVLTLPLQTTITPLL